MAEIDNYLVGPSDTPQGNGVGAADFGRTLAAGTTNVGSNAASLLRYGWELGGSEGGAEIAKGVQQLFSAGTESIEGGMSPETRKLAAAAMTSAEFWEHPVLATSLKATRMVPTVAAIAIPGGLLADVVGASVVAAGAGGALNAADGIDEFYQKLDAMSDKELQEQSAKYRTMREMMDEGPARARFNKEAQGWGPAINAVLGAVSGTVGPGGVAARAIAGGGKNAVIGAGERGVLGSAGIAAAEGVATNALEEGVSDASVQSAEINADLRKEFDRAKIANSALEGGVMGGLFGGAVGLVTGGHKPAQPPKLAQKTNNVLNSADDANPVATTTPAGPQVKEGSASTPPAKPIETMQVGNPQNAPVRGERDAGKQDTKTAPPEIPVDQTPPMDPGITAAVAANQGEPVTSAPNEVAAMAQRSPNATLDRLDTEGQPPVPAGVTPPALDTGQNVPEQPASIVEQIAQIGTGDRKAVMLPKGTVVGAANLGGRTDLKSMVTPRGRFIFDPKLVSRSQITKLSAAGRENELLGLGPVSKPAAVADAAAGATPVAVTERTPAGTEVKAAAGTTVTLPAQRASLEAQKTPGNVVTVETPENVLQMRQPGQPVKPTGRVLPNLQTTAETTPLSDLTYTEPKDPDAAGPGKNYRGKAGKERDAKIAAAKQIVERNAPDVEFEREYLRSPVVRDKVIARAQAMLADAKQAGLTIQAQLKKSTKGDAASDDPAIQILRLAKDLDKVASKHKEGSARTEATKAFAEAERLIRAGHSDEVLATRREEGDARFKRNVAADQVAAAGAIEAPQAALDEGGVQDTVANEKIVGKDDVTTSTAASAKMGVRGVSAPTEVTPEGTERAKAASPGKVLSAEEKAAIAERMGLTVSKGAPSRAPTKAKPKLAPLVPKKEVAKPAVKVEEEERLTPAQAAARATSDARRKQLEDSEDAAAAWLKANDPDALVVNTNPSEAQIRAGNYKKGHRRVEGLDFTIENPKGAIRRGGEPGDEWQVRMPADYGYIRRTSGADGEHIDAYDGRSGDRYFIVDQLDERTGAFDEHKVMLRFKSEQDAISTYHAAFSDGKGRQRLGMIHEVTPTELKQWLDQGDTTRPVTQHIFGEDPVMTPLAPGEPVGSDNMIGPDGQKINFIRSDYLANELDRLQLDKQTGIGGTLGKFFLSRFKKLAEKTDHVVHYVTAEQMRLIAPNTPDAAGLHQRMPDGTSAIFIQHTLRDNGLENGSLAHVLMHETAHAVTVREIDSNAAAKSTIRRMMRIAADWLEHPDNAPHVELLYGAEASRGDVTRYAFTNEKEFIAEAYSNKGFQELMTQIPVNDPVLSEYLGLNKRSMSIWDVFRGFVRKAVEKITGKASTTDSMMDAIMKVGEGLELRHIDHYLNPKDVPQGMQFAEAEAFDMVTKAADGVRRMLESHEANKAENAPKNLALRTFDNIAQMADNYFGESNPVRKIHNAIERQRVTGEKIFQKSEPLVKQLTELRAKNRAQYEEFSSLLHDATVANVHPDVPLTDPKNAHLGKSRLDSVWSKAAHQELAKRFRALPEEFKSSWKDTVQHFTGVQNSMSLGIIENQILKLLGIEDSNLAARIHSQNLTDADRALLGDNLDVIEKASELSKIEGPYVPLMRRGDHVVKGDYKVTLPGNATKISDNELEFSSRKEAEDYAKASPLKADIKKIWVDPKTGERLGADELDSVDRYRVTVQNRHVEFVQGRGAAEARAAELAKDGSIIVHKVVPRSLELDARQGAELSTALSGLVKKLEHSSAYEAASPTQRAALRQAIEEAALASHGSTRVSSRALPRRGVVGFSEDLVQNTVDYGESSSRYLAKLEHATELEAGLKEMAETLNRDHSKVGQYARTAISNEVRKRVEGDNGFKQGGKFAPVVKRLLSASFTDKLASPAYSVINAMQTGMVTMPYLAGRFGVSRSFAALGKAYADINTRSVLKEGAAGTVRNIKGRSAQVSLTDMVMKNLTKDERAMVQYNIDLGTIDASAGMEVQNIAKSYEGVGGKFDAVLGYLEGVTREMPRAIETINRTVTALAAYRLEISRGATHDAAVRFSQDAINSTQFNYSPTNSPGVFNHPLLKIALQFKKYGQGMYQLIGTQIGVAIRNMEPGDRPRAVKTLIGIAATHMAMAGALGLPTEPFKYLVMASSPFTGMTWSDVENEIRKQAAALFGKVGGEVATRGLPRLLNLDLSRMGLDSVTSFGEPRGNKESDVKSWLFDSVSGPVVSLGGDYVKGINLLANGEVTKAAEKLIPLKVAADSIRAYRQASEGKKSGTGKQTSAPYSPTEAGLRALGFGTGREAEEGSANSAYYRGSAKAKEERNSLVSAWVEAAPDKKAKAWAAVQKFNLTAAAETKITAKELTDKARREAKSKETAVRGINPNKRDKRFLDEGFIYNTR